MSAQKEGTQSSNTCLWNGKVSNRMIQWYHSSMHIHRMFNKAKLTKLGRVAVQATQAIGVQLVVVPCKEHTRRMPNYQLPFFNNTKDQTSPSNEKATKAPMSIVALRSVTAYRVEKFCADYKIINNIPIRLFNSLK